MVVISGAPGLSERSDRPLLHHCVRKWSTQLDVFEKVTAVCAEITDPDTAFREIDRVLDVCFRQKRPVSIELPRDMVDVVPDSIRPYAAPKRRSRSLGASTGSTGASKTARSSSPTSATAPSR